MPNIVRLKYLLLLAIALFGAMAGGCTPLRLPAIDPSGDSIFLSSPNYTTLAAPFEAPSRYSCLPTPAYTQPPPVPACELQPGPPPDIVPGTIAPPVVTVAPTALPGQERLIVTPSRMIAPINSEVVLLAGVADTRGAYVARRPVEWILSQDSVGHFVDVGENRRHHFHHLLDSRTRKVTGSYALTRTSSAARLITRGTPGSQDDVMLNEGQSWLSLTSATEGVSYVTAIATGGSNWEERRKIARIHWVDAQWTLPGPVVVRAGTPHLLTTTVSRGSTGRPNQNWSVRYEVTGGLPASFAPTGQTVVEVPTDAAGRASVQLVPLEQNSGSTQVRVDILAPEAADGSAPIAVGQGWVTVTWSAANLDARITGPSSLALDGTGTYRLLVSNPGDLPATNVLLSTRIPQNLGFLNSDPPGQRIGNRIEWKVGTLEPGRSAQFDVNCRALREGELRFQARATADNLSRVAELTTRVIAPSLKIRVVDGPAAGKVGDRIQFNIEVTNIGSVRLSNVTVRDRFDRGLEHTFNQPSPIERSLGNLAPGQVRQFGVSFFVRRVGQLCHTIEASADGGQFVSEEVCIQATRPALSLEVTETGPAKRAVGEEADLVIEVTNTGEGVLTNLQILTLPAESMAPHMLSPEYRVTPAGLVWQLDELKPKQTVRREVVCKCTDQDPDAVSRVRVSSAEGVVRETSTRTVITEVLTSQVAARSASRDSGERSLLHRDEDSDRGSEQDTLTGELMVSLTASSSAPRKGDHVTYFVVIKNGRTTADKNIKVEFQVPAGMRFERFKADSLSLTARSSDGVTYRCDTVAEIRPGGVRQFMIELIALREGEHKLQGTVTSIRTPQPIQIEEKIVIARHN